MELTAVTPKSKSAPNSLTGRTVELPNDSCRYGSSTAVIDRDRRLNCRSCGRSRGLLSAFTANWIAEVIDTVGADKITLQGPAL